MTFTIQKTATASKPFRTVYLVRLDDGAIVARFWLEQEAKDYVARRQQEAARRKRIDDHARRVILGR